MSLGQARLWQGQLKKPGLKAELSAPDLAEPGLYLLGRPRSRLSLVFQYPPGREVPKEVGEKLWRQVETLLPQDNLPLIVADSGLLVRPAPPQALAAIKEKLRAWAAAQEVKFTDDLARLYSDPFVYYEPGQKPQSIGRESFQVALASEARTSGDVKLAVSEPLIALDPRNHNRAWAVFSLRYDSRLRHDLGLRTLIFEKNLLGDDWLVKAELWIREAGLKG
jgi:ketosteroid isomerase-like protein